MTLRYASLARDGKITAAYDYMVANLPSRIELRTAADAVLATFSTTNPGKTGPVLSLIAPITTTVTTTGTVAKLGWMCHVSGTVWRDMFAFTVGTSGAEVNFDSVSLVAGGLVTITSLTVTENNP